MLRMLPAVAAIVLLVLAGPASRTCDAGTSIAIAIDTNPGSAFPANQANTVYVWSWLIGHLATEFDFGLYGSHTIVSVTPAPHWANEGSPMSPHLVAEPGYVAAVDPIAAIEVVDLSSPGSVCFTESDLTARLCFRSADDGAWYRLDHFGLDTEGPSPCNGHSTSSACEAPVSTEGTSWGGVKSRYRGPGR